MAREPKLTPRSIEIFQELVDAYMETGEAVGSRFLSKRSHYPLSAATIRNTMADLEDLGLLYAPHASAGRIPTEAGFSFFVNGLLECSDFSDFESHDLEHELEPYAAEGIEAVLEKASALLSGLSKYAGIVLAPQSDPILQRIEFVSLSENQLLVVIIADSGQIENRLIQGPGYLTPDRLKEMSNYLSDLLRGKTVAEGIQWVQSELDANQSDLNSTAVQLLKQSLEPMTKKEKQSAFVLKGRANLLDHVDEIGELERVRNLFEVIETKETMIHLLDATAKAKGIQVFIGSENKHFNLSGCSLVASPYKTSNRRFVGAVGVVGPTNMNYRQILPLVSCTSKIISRILNEEHGPSKAKSRRRP